MKTTVEIPDDLLLAAKKLALDLRVPLRVLVERSLRAQVASHRSDSTDRERSIRWVTVPGGLPEGLDVSDREQMHAWLDGRRD
ncbi:MAG: hypothetical protein R6V85_11210 [Polyangia bacterium]